MENIYHKNKAMPLHLQQILISLTWYQSLTADVNGIKINKFKQQKLNEEVGEWMIRNRRQRSHLMMKCHPTPCLWSF